MHSKLVYFDNRILGTACANLIKVSISETSQLRNQVEVAVQYTRVNEDECEEGTQQTREVAVEQLLSSKMNTQQWWY